MKITFGFILLILIAISVTKCKKDDAVNSSLKGEWKMTDAHCDDGMIVLDPGGLNVSGTFSFQGLTYNATTTFTDNPDQFTSTGSYTALYTTVILGATTMDTIEVPVDSDPGAWSIKGDTLIQDINGETTKSIILEMTGSKLRLRNDLDVTVPISGAPAHNTATVFTTFEKQ